MEPEAFGRYRLLESIGRGGMAEVFLAKQEGIAGIERRLAIKRIHPQFTTDENFVKMFIDEARIVGHFNHQNIVQMLDFGKIADSYYIAMEYVDGINLAGIMGTMLKRSDRIPTEAIVEIGIQVAQGMDYAHNGTDQDGVPLNIIHRDLTPHNILVNRGGTIKITDFGIAKASMNTHMTQAGMIKGKVPYMSPEQAMGQPLDKRSDIFSIGIILYEMCTLQRLFHGQSDFHVLQKVIAAQIPDIRAQNPDVPEDLERIIRKLLSQNRDNRYSNAAELADDLRRLKFSMGETFATFSLGEYVTRVMEMSGKIPPGRGTTAATPGVKPALPSAFEALVKPQAEAELAARQTPTEGDDDVRTVLIESVRAADEDFGSGDQATRLIHTGETARDEVMASLREDDRLPALKPALLDDVMEHGDPEATMLAVGTPAGGTSRAEVLKTAADPRPSAPQTVALKPALMEQLGPEETALPATSQAPTPPASVEVSPTRPQAPKTRRNIVIAVIVLALLGLVAFLAKNSAKSGAAVTVQVTPAGARILMDGVVVSESGVWIQDGLPTGKPIRLRAEKEGFVPWEEEVTLTEEESRGIPVTLAAERPPEGFLQIQTDPPGARVSVGGTALQQVSPVRVALVAGEKATLTFEKEGFRPLEKVIDVTVGQMDPLIVVLEPAAPAGAPGAPGAPADPAAKPPTNP